MTRNKEWLVPLTGVAFIVVGFVGFIVGGEPKGADEPVAEVVDFYLDSKDSIQAAAFIGVAASLLMVFFGAYLRKVLAAAEGPGGGVLPALALTATAIVAVGAAIDSTISVALAESAEDIEPAAVQALQALWDNDFVPFALGAELFLISVGLSVVRHGALPKWLGWAALVLAVVGFTPVGFVAFVGAGLWVIVASLILALRVAPATPRTSP
jgi:hypothetical protein